MTASSISPATLESNAEKTSMEIHGKTEWWYTDDSKNWKCIFFCERQSKEKDWLRHFLDLSINVQTLINRILNIISYSV